MHDELARAEVGGAGARRLLPARRRRRSAAPEQRRLGIQEFGLPYAADPAITRHLAAFLRRHGAPTDGDLVERRRAQVGGHPRAHPRGADLVAGRDAARARERRARSGGRARRRLLRAGPPRRRRAHHRRRGARLLPRRRHRAGHAGAADRAVPDTARLRGGRRRDPERARARAAHQPAGALPPVLVVGSRRRSRRAAVDPGPPTRSPSCRRCTRCCASSARRTKRR